MRGLGPDNSAPVPMSALGQKRALERVRPLSALPPKADIVQHGGNVRFVPKADIPSPHSITSSARAMIVAGISRPMAFAVFRLITNSKVTDCAMGRSPGLVPRRI